MLVPLRDQLKQQQKKLKSILRIPAAPKKPAPKKPAAPKNKTVIVSKTKLQEIQNKMKTLMKPCKPHQQRNPKTNRCKNKSK